MTPAQRVLLDAATRGPFLPTPRQRPVARALVARGWLARGVDMRFALTEAGRAAHYDALKPRTWKAHVIENWERARERRMRNVGR